MAITLENIFTHQDRPGDPVDVYDTARIVAWSVDLLRKEVTVRLQLGTEAAGVFTAGTARLLAFVLENQPAHLGAGGTEVPEDTTFDDLEAAGFSEAAICTALTKARSGQEPLCAGTVVADTFQ